MIPLNDLKRAIAVDSASDISRVMEKVLQSGSYILGHEVKSFEREFASYLGVKSVSSVASGTDALIIALRSLGVAAGSKVLVVPNAGGYTTTALIAIGATPVFVDCDDLGRMEQESLKRKLLETPEAACVVATHLYGLDSNIQGTLEICKSFGVSLIEDCAQSAGASVGGRKLGSFGDVATFSFYPTKNLGAVGDAGAIATNADDLARQHLELRQYGWSERYEVKTAYGQNSRMDELQAAVLRYRLPLLDGQNYRRRDIWEAYATAVEGSSWRIIGFNADRFVAHLGVLVCPNGLRDLAANFLQRQGISTSVHYPILDYRQPGWNGLTTGDCPNAEDLNRRILTIPLFPELTNEEVNAIAGALSEMSKELSVGV